MIIANIIWFLSIFILLLIFIPIGSLIYNKSKNIASILMVVIGLSIPYFSSILIMSKFNEFSYRWFHFVGVFLLIGAMNNGNLKRETSKRVELISIFLFFGTIVMSVLLFWII